MRLTTSNPLYFSTEQNSDFVQRNADSTLVRALDLFIPSYSLGPSDLKDHLPQFNPIHVLRAAEEALPRVPPSSEAQLGKGLLGSCPSYI